MIRPVILSLSAALVTVAGSLFACSPRTSPPEQVAAQPATANGSAASNTPTPTASATTTAAPAPEQPMDPLLAQWKDIPVDPATGTVTLTEKQWQERLTPEQYRILRQKGTERAFTGKLWNTGGPGEYRCAACGNLLFTGEDKFVSECGWPAFDKAIKGSIRYESDRSYGMIRTEVMCNRCGGHLGHVFEDGPTDTGTRYCINSVSILYIPGTTTSKHMETEAIVEAPPKK